MAKQLFAVIGLGSFGETIALELARLNHEVLGVDMDERRVNALAEDLTHVAVADASNEKVLEELNIRQYDAVVVAIGRNVEASILCTMQLKTLGIKQVWVKALTIQHHRILAKIGADRIIHPEFEMGVRVAQALNYPMVNNYIGLGGDDFVVEIIASKKLQNRKVGELLIHAHESADVLLVKRAGGVFKQPDTDFLLEEKDHIILSGRLQDLRKLAAYI